MADFDLRGRLAQYIGFMGHVSHAGGFLLRKITKALRHGDLGIFKASRINTLREQAFAEWYKAVGDGFANFESTTPVPSLVARAQGVVLDLGPGTGNQLSRLSPARVEHVYGVEPNAFFAGVLAERVRKDAPGLEGRYTLVLAAAGQGAEAALGCHGIFPGDIDCVLCMQVLCSIGNARAAAREVYDMLKPGGELLFWEHCASKDWLTWSVQGLYSLLWPVVCGGCQLNRDIKDILLSAGDWEEVEIEEDADPKDLLPRVSGRLVKRRE